MITGGVGIIGVTTAKGICAYLATDIAGASTYSFSSSNDSIDFLSPFSSNTSIDFLSPFSSNTSFDFITLRD